MGQNGLVERFRGRFVAKFDDRGRIKIPSRYLSILEQNYSRDVYLTSVNGDHILFYPMKVWEQIEEKIERIKMRGPEVEEYISRISYWGTESEIDPKGRILIPPYLRESSKLNGEVFILGKVDYLVLWNKEIFEARYLAGNFTDEKLQRVSGVLNELSALSGHE